MRKLLTPALFLLVPLVNAQNWMVGTPVNFHLSDLLCAGLPPGCYPAPDSRFNFPISYVFGVQHAAVVDGVSVPDCYVTPGPPGPLSLGDTIWIDLPGARDVFFPSGYGSLTLRFIAVGIPTTDGQPHPCVYNDLWLGFGLCPAQNTLTLSTTCTVQPGTVGIAEGVANNGSFIFPGPTNGQLLTCTGAAEVEVYTIGGERIARSADSSIRLQGVSEGVYLARARMPDGRSLIQRFVLLP